MSEDIVDSALGEPTTMNANQSLAIVQRDLGPTGPSFAAALCGFLSTTVATTALFFLLSNYA